MVATRAIHVRPGQFAILTYVLKPAFHSFLHVALLVSLTVAASAAQPAAPQLAEPDANARLQQAAMTGDPSAVKAALADKAAIDAPGDSRMTALGIAALYVRDEVIRALVAAGASVPADQDGESALAVAAHEGHTRAVEALLGAGADVDARDANGITPLMAAASSNRAGAIRALLSKGARTSMRPTPMARDGTHCGRLRRPCTGGGRPGRRRRRPCGTRQGGRTALMASALGGNAAQSRKC